MRAVRWPAAAAIACATLGLTACGNQVVVTAGDAATNYVYAVAEGNDALACSAFTTQARAALVADARPRASCRRVLARCLPGRFRVSSADQSQLLYATTDIVTHGNRATVGLSATAAASAVHSVNLVHLHGRWLLTSPGRVITRCLSHERRRRHG